MSRQSIQRRSSIVIDPDISLRMSILRYLMICGIVILHVPPYVPLTETGSDLFSWVKAFFSHAVFRSTVPVLTCISGYLLFASGLDQKFKRLIVKKTKGILIPLVIWNLPLVLLLYAIQSLDLSSHQFSATVYPFEWIAWINGIIGALKAPVNYPLNFLRDLYVLALLAPVFGMVLRHFPLLGLALVTVVFFNNWDGQLLLRNTMAVNFYIGGLAAVRSWNLRYLDRFAWPLFGTFILFSVMIVIFQIEDRRLFVMLAPFLIWPLSSIIANAQVGSLIANLSKYSFFVFLSHGPILLLMSIFYEKFIDNTQSVTFWVVAPMLTISGAHLIYSILLLRTPGLLSFIIGGR